MTSPSDRSTTAPNGPSEPVSPTTLPSTDDKTGPASAATTALSSPTPSPGNGFGGLGDVAAPTTPGTPSSQSGAPQGGAAGQVTSPVQVHTEHPGGQAATTVRLPFITATFTRNPPTSTPGPASAPQTIGAPQATGPAAPGVQQTVQQTVQQATASPGARQRLLLYTGAAVLGVAGIVEWPVVGLVAAGTYVATRGRRSQSTR